LYWNSCRKEKQVLKINEVQNRDKFYPSEDSYVCLTFLKVTEVHFGFQCPLISKSRGYTVFGKKIYGALVNRYLGASKLLHMNLTSILFQNAEL
jgi:hypothetical protein